MSNFLARCIFAVIWIVTLPPLGMLYIMERPLAFILQNLLSYRKYIIKVNLNKSFPEKSGEDLSVITKKYYLWMARIFIESIKALHWSTKKLRKRFHLVNPEILLEHSSAKQDIIILTGHTANWEWTPGAICPLGFDLLGIYKPQTNKVFDLLTQMIRKKEGIIPTPMKGTMRVLSEQMKSESKPRALLLIADQIPALGDIHYWETFLNQPTAWFTGAEKIALRKRLPVYFLKTKQVKKGFYSAEFLPLFDGESKTSDLEITQFYIHALEKTIQENPAHWLWSHRRWKHQPENLSL
jgi:KDO2-lipid IV(A) lauroyltransferase